ncbi:hypothetical protein [Alistipes putredinis]|uniref:hypothetical protein n=1 Tax=Alistipes putredinis TaxID=28117 RepID=UPI00242F81F9|nr:hypothetical protein [Alistipes putredinis]
MRITLPLGRPVSLSPDTTALVPSICNPVLTLGAENSPPVIVTSALLLTYSA